MPGVIDPRSIAGMQNGLIVLDKGLDLSSHKYFAPPGSLADCWNVEMVDGRLQVIKGAKRHGGTALNQIVEKWWVFTGVKDTDFTMPSGELSAGPTLVEWYEGPAVTALTHAAGRGLLYYLNAAGANPLSTEPVLAIGLVEGEPPARYTYFKEVDSSLDILISTSERFHLPGPPWNDLSSYDAGYIAIGLNGNGYSGTSDDTWDALRPSPLGHGAVSHVFGYKDQSYAVKDFPVIGFVSGEEKPSIGDKIQINNGTGTDPTFYVAGVEETFSTIGANSWEAGSAKGWLYVYPQSDSTLIEADIDGWDDFVDINNLTTGNPLGKTILQSIAFDTVVSKSHGLLWKLDDEGLLNTGWKYVDTGYSVRFNAGAVAPLVVGAPLFVTDAVDVLQDTGFVALTSPATEFPTTGTYSAWAGLSNVASDNATYASTTIAANDFSRVMQLSLSSASDIPGDAKILGIEVTFEAGNASGTDVTANKLHLVHINIDDDLVNPATTFSENRALGANHEYAAGYDVITAGGPLDLWGFKEITLADINAGNLRVWMQFENANAAARSIEVDYVLIKIHYAMTAQALYFYDGTADVATGNLIGYQVFDGEWSTDDAQGWMSFSSLATPSAIPAGTEIRTAAAGAGTKIAEVLAVSKNLLPSYKEMEQAGARCRSYESNLGAGQTHGRVFVTNGISPCFTLDKDGHFQFIRTPVDPDKDHPRYVSELANHLVLDIDGHAFVSSIGSFNNFSTYDGATTWNTNDDITGLIKAPANTLIVLCRDSLHTLTGSGASGNDAFRLQTHSTSGGARHYTAQYVGEPMFLDNYGLATFSTTDKYGDFDENSMNYGIEPWLQPRLAAHTSSALPATLSPVDSYLVRSKGQYRVLFGDSWQLTSTLPGPEAQDPRPLFTLQNPTMDYGTVNAVYHTRLVADAYFNDFVYTSVASYVTSWGEERVLFGTKSGQVLRGEQGIYNQGYPVYYSFAINPVHGANPITDILKVSAVSILYVEDGTTWFYVDVATDGLLPQYANVFNAAHAMSLNNASTTDAYAEGGKSRVATFHGFALSNAISWRVMGITGAMHGAVPLTFVGLAPVSSSKGTSRARIPTSHSLGTTTGVQP